MEKIFLKKLNNTWKVICNFLKSNYNDCYNLHILLIEHDKFSIKFKEFYPMFFYSETLCDFISDDYINQFIKQYTTKFQIKQRNYVYDGLIILKNGETYQYNDCISKNLIKQRLLKFLAANFVNCK